MSAKEMFEKLGYKLIGNVGGLTYCNENIILGDLMIRFEEDYKLVKYYYNQHKNYANDTVLPQKITINTKLHQAIHEQMKELGWLSEN